MRSKTGFPWFSSFSSVMGKLGQSVADFASLMMEAKDDFNVKNHWKSRACMNDHLPMLPNAVIPQSHVGMGQHQDQLRTSLQQLIWKVICLHPLNGWEFKMILIVASTQSGHRQESKHLEVILFKPFLQSIQSVQPKFDQGTSATIWSRPVCLIRACHGNCKE